MHGKNDHELKIGSTTERFTLMRDENGSAMYHVETELPAYRSPLEFHQDNWVGGHGQYEYKARDMYFEGENIDTTQDGVFFLGPLPNEVTITGPTYLDSAPVKFMWCPWAAPKLLCATAGNIYYFDGTYWVASAITGNGAIDEVTDLCFFNGVAYAARSGTAGKTYYTSINGTTWTATDLTEDEMQGFFNAPNAAGTANILWGFKDNKLYYTTDGAASGSQWDSGASIGDTSNDITNVFLVNDNLMVGRTDNLYHYDSDGGVHPLMDDLKHNRSTNNFKYVWQWQSGTYFSLGRGLAEITSYNQFEPMGPLTGIDEIGKYGDCVGGAADKDYQYVAMDEGTNTHIYKGREVREGGVLRWEWCPWIKLGTRTCATMAVIQHSSTDRRLWFGYTSGTNYSTAYVKLTDDPLATGSGAEFNTAGGFIRMSYEYGTNPYWDKLWQSVVTETTGCSANVNVTPQYRDDQDTTATALTAAITSNGVVKTDLSSAINNKRIQFELHLATNSSGSTPEVTVFTARGVEKPETVRIHEAIYAIGDEPTTRAKTLRDLLRTARTTTQLVRFADLRYHETTGGTANTDFVYCVMEPDYPQEVEIIHTQGRAPELGIKVRLREVLTSATYTQYVDAITITSAGDHDMIYYDTATSKWVNGTEATILSQLSAQAAAAFDFNSQNLTSVGDISAADLTLSGTTTALTFSGAATVVAGSGLTLPAHTSGVITFNAINASARDADNTYSRFRGGTNAAGKGAAMVVLGVDTASYEGQLWLQTPNAAENADLTRLVISGDIDTAVATWSNVTHTGIVLSGALNANSQNLTSLGTLSAFTLAGMLDMGGQALGDGTDELLTFTEVASAINNIEITNADIGSQPIIAVVGDDTNISMHITPKGTGHLNIDRVLPSTAAQELEGLMMVVDASAQVATSIFHALEVSTTGTPAGEVAALATIGKVKPIHQHVATPATPDQSTPDAYAGRKTGGGVTWADGLDGIAIFADDDDAIFVGSATRFDEIEVIMGTGATKDVQATFWYSSASTWSPFFPSDGTEGFQDSGNVSWSVSEITATWTNDGDPGVGDTAIGYWIKIVRTRTGTVGAPVPTTVKIGASTEYEWDEAGDLTVKGLTYSGTLYVFDAGGETISGDGTDLTIASGALINLTATSDVVLPVNIGLIFGDGAEKIESNNTDFTINSGGELNLTATSDVVIPVNVGLHLGDGGEKLESDDANLTINSGGELRLTATSDVVIPVNIGLHLGDGAEKLESNNTDLTINSGGAINLTATSDVVVPANIGVTFGTGEKIEGDNTDLTITSGGDINLTATSDVVVGGYLTLKKTDTDGDAEGELWYDDSDNKLRFFDNAQIRSLPTVSTADRSIYVDKEASGAADGTSYTDAFTTIQAAQNDLEDIVIHAHTIYCRDGTKKTGTADENTLNHLVDDGNAQFVSGDVGKRVFNVTDSTWGVVGSFVDTGDVGIVDTADANLDLFPDGNEDYVMEATPYRETIYLNSLPATNPAKLILGSVTIQAEYYWQGDCDVQANAGEILDATADFTNVELGDRVFVIDLNGGGGTAQDYEVGTVDDISQVGSDIVRTTLTKTPVANWKYVIVKTELSGSDDGTDPGTARNDCFNGSGIQNVYIQGFLMTFPDAYHNLFIDGSSAIYIRYNMMLAGDRGSRVVNGSAITYSYNYAEGEYTIWAEFNSSADINYSVLYATATTERGLYVVRHSFSSFDYSVLDTGVGGADGEAVWCHNNSAVQLYKGTITNGFAIGIYARGNSYVSTSTFTNSATAPVDPVGTSEGAYIS